MKTRIHYILVTLPLFSTLTPQLSTVFAQGTAFTYQGRLNGGGNPASGSYDLTFTLFATNTSGVAIAGPVTNSATAVSNGLFTTTVDFGSGIFTDSSNWLEIAVRTNGTGSFNTLAPRQQLTPTPYAILAENVNAAGISGTIPAANFSGTYGNAVNFNNGADSFDGTFSGQFFGSTFIGGTFVGDFVGNGSGLTDVWQTGGNSGTTAGANFVGTTDNQPLELHVNGLRAFRLEPTANTGFATSAVNVIGGSPANFAGPGILGVTIAGGGAPYYFGSGTENRVLDNFGTIGGGVNNDIETNAFESTIGGGNANTILPGAYRSTISGGWANTIGTNANHSVIGGGYFNSVQIGSVYSVVDGGFFNTIQNTNAYSVIGGGGFNTIQTNAGNSVIAGGINNIVYYNSTYGGIASTISGGNDNVTGGNGAVVGGGFSNQATNTIATVGGGVGNIALAYGATVAGGQNNLASGTEAFIGGGGGGGLVGHTASGAYSTIGGGSAQTAAADFSAILGGANNAILNGATCAFIGGGQQNNILSYSGGAAISGGRQNIIQTNNQGSAIGGGYGNTIQSSEGSVNVIAANTIAGGVGNVIQTNALYAVIAGGSNNQIGNNFASVGGGIYNTNDAYYGTIPGGYGNYAAGLYSFAAGNRAQALYAGDFVWADSQNTNFAATTSDQFSVRAQGGVVFVTGGAGMTLDGQPILGSSSFAPASGSANYIQNQTAVPQTASFNINGNATVGGTLTANSISGNGTAVTGVNAALLEGFDSTNFWKTTGNAGTTPGVNFIGTTDNRALLIRGSFVGIGRTSAVTGSDYFSVEAPVGAGAYGGMYIDTTTAGARPFYGYSQAGSADAWTYVDGTDANKWKLNVGGFDRITVTTSGNVGIGTNSPTNLLQVGSSASPAYCNGTTWVNGSDRNSKSDFAAINPREVLDKVSALPITEWQYKAEAVGTKHLGPVAQDFHAAFGLNGADDKHIATVDEEGVALAAIQGLNQKLNERDAEIQDLKSRLERLEKILTTRDGGEQ